MAIESGIYKAQFSADRFAPVTQNQIVVTGTRNTILNAQLNLTVSETVEVKSRISSENSEQLSATHR